MGRQLIRSFVIARRVISKTLFLSSLSRKVVVRGRGNPSFKADPGLLPSGMTSMGY